MQNVEHDFISGVLSEEELGNTMHVHEVKSGFACQIRNLRSYDAISRAILQRWSFPLVVDSGLLHPAASETTYSYKRQNRYRYTAAATRLIVAHSIATHHAIDKAVAMVSTTVQRHCSAFCSAVHSLWFVDSRLL